MAIDYTKEYRVEGYGDRKPTDRPYLDMDVKTSAEPMAMSEDETPEVNGEEVEVEDDDAQGSFSF